MKKWALGIVSIVTISCISFSCSQSKSLQELLQEEKKAIDRFITMNDLVILKDYPKDGFFKGNEYFKTSDGLFFQVVNPGNGTKVQLRDEVSLRYEYAQSIKSVTAGDTTKHYFPDHPSYPNYSYPRVPFSFVYGIPQTYTSDYYPLCQAWVVPLTYVGEDAIVNLIVPSSIGSKIDSYPGILPVFYKNLHYTRFN